MCNFIFWQLYLGKSNIHQVLSYLNVIIIFFIFLLKIIHHRVCACIVDVPEAISPIGQWCMTRAEVSLLYIYYIKPSTVGISNYQRRRDTHKNIVYMIWCCCSSSGGGWRGRLQIFTGQRGTPAPNCEKQFSQNVYHCLLRYRGGGGFEWTKLVLIKLDWIYTTEIKIVC